MWQPSYVKISLYQFRKLFLSSDGYVILKNTGFLSRTLFMLAAVAIFKSWVFAGNWPQFRGPLGSGHIPGGQALPSEWSEMKNVDWKVELSGRAWSSPVVLGDKIWLTTADEKGNKLTGLCVDANNGKIILKNSFFTLPIRSSRTSLIATVHQRRSLRRGACT